MANFYGTFRSNRFRVKDREAFLKELEPVNLNILWDSEDRVLLMPDEYSDDGMWPSQYYDDEYGDGVDFDIVGVIQKHIADNECAILIQIGSEKMRYLEGYSIAITSDEIITINLNDIYERASQMVSGEVTRAEY